MEFFRDSNIDFMRYRRFWVTVSAAAIVGAFVAVFIHGSLNIGIDFAGGTQLTVRFREAQDIEELRTWVSEAGIEDPLIQRFGEPGANEVLIKAPLLEDSEEGSQALIVRALDEHLNPEGTAELDLNQQGSDALQSFLAGRDPDRTGQTADDSQGEDEAEDPFSGLVEEESSHYATVADAIIDKRQEDGILDSWEEVRSLDVVSDATLELLESEARLGAFAVLGAENVGPQIGSELRRKGISAVVFSLIGMLGYIWFRFELRFGIGALAAVLHDVLICLGVYAVLDFEFNLTTIAAFLTLVGYSVNDSVVIFDRVRENMRRTRRDPLVEVLNRSVNQTMGRTVLTSGTTFLAVGTLFLFGGDVIRGFSFVLMLGVIVGTYSSVFIASPFVLLWERFFGAEARSRRSETRRQPRSEAEASKVAR